MTDLECFGRSFDWAQDDMKKCILDDMFGRVARDWKGGGAEDRRERSE